MTARNEILLHTVQSLQMLHSQRSLGGREENEMMTDLQLEVHAGNKKRHEGCGDSCRCHYIRDHRGIKRQREAC